ncbi:hypothetical protein JKP88DRAFT_247499 [Tribonema minus]|uniref:Coatomer subunit zeta n=1 Tax=Tribonema minus TaxID=303371 RepID=A0A835YRG5_9STRA|nr:hypothetical protein JKP88DRAFT_247499 [Tribonema minus]
MVMHSLLILNERGHLLMGRYFDEVLECGALQHLGDVASDREQCMQWWEDEVRQQTREMWQFAHTANQVARGADDVIIIYRRIGDLLVFACGRDDCDELTLSDVVDCLGGVIATLCEDSSAKGARPTESWLMIGDTYAKVALAVDEMMPGGILEALDPDAVLSMTKMRPIA